MIHVGTPGTIRQNMFVRTLHYSKIFILSRKILMVVKHPHILKHLWTLSAMIILLKESSCAFYLLKPMDFTLSFSLNFFKRKTHLFLLMPGHVLLNFNISLLLILLLIILELKFTTS